jgi:hypothetical protein
MRSSVDYNPPAPVLFAAKGSELIEDEESAPIIRKTARNCLGRMLRELAAAARSIDAVREIASAVGERKRQSGVKKRQKSSVASALERAGVAASR